MQIILLLVPTRKNDLFKKDQKACSTSHNLRKLYNNYSYKIKIVIK